MKEIIVVNKINGEINRVGLYEVGGNRRMKWVKWLRKKDYREYVLINKVEILEQEI